jgi:hypothetical protein
MLVFIPAQQCRGAVGRTVIDDDQFITCEHLAQDAVQRLGRYRA